MKKKYFQKTEFWTREFRLPLFWLSKITGNNSLVFYKNSVLHIYYLNDRHIKATISGYKFFTDKKKVARYKQRVGDLLSEIKQVKEKYENINIKKISEIELENRFWVIMRFLNRYVVVYTRTEAVYLAKFEGEKYNALIKRLGEMRFSLRKAGDPIFYILLGVLLKEIGRRFGIRTKDLFFYTEDEIKKLFEKKKVAGSVVERRAKGYALIITKNKERLLIGKEFKELFKEVASTKKTKEFSGQVAKRGFVTGRIKMILHNKRNISKEVKKFKKGEILVTEMTRPGTILACRKAAAIITDEGGIMSHAAIISRELGIPCVIGTKIATQILKDGDLVEVDANKGVVKVIKKKE